MNAADKITLIAGAVLAMNENLASHPCKFPPLNHEQIRVLCDGGEYPEGEGENYMDVLEDVFGRILWPRCSAEGDARGWLLLAHLTEDDVTAEEWEGVERERVAECHAIAERFPALALHVARLSVIYSRGEFPHDDATHAAIAEGALSAILCQTGGHVMVSYAVHSVDGRHILTECGSDGFTCYAVPAVVDVTRADESGQGPTESQRLAAALYVIVGDACGEPLADMPMVAEFWA